MILDNIINFLSNGLTGFSGWQIVAYTLIVTHITIASVTIYLHRCQAHRALDVHPILGHFFRFWLWMTTGMGTKQWTAVHRKHHAKCETPEDPHSPQVLGLKKVLLEGAELYRIGSRNQETLDKYGQGTPNDWLEHNLYMAHQRLGLYSMLAIDVALFGVIGITVWAIQMIWIPLFAAGVINGVGHFFGYRNFNCEDASTNVFPWGILIGGEELHNNHHTFGSSAKLSYKWYEFDIGWMYIRLLSFVGLTKIRKVLPKPKIGSTRAICDVENLQLVISNRYEVMSTYARSLRQTFSAEYDRLLASCADRELLKKAKRLLQKDANQLSPAESEHLSKIFANSTALKAIYDMRAELSSLWARSSATKEQLLQQLQDWCARAEASGIEKLREFSLRLKSYA